jgi:prevent-host-death family protein
MIDLTIAEDIQPVTAFRRKPASFFKRLKKTRRPVVLTVNGKAAAIVQDVDSYQRLLDVAAQADASEAVRQGLDDIAHGRTRPAQTVFNEIRRRRGISR